MEAASATDEVVAPGTQHFHPGHPKAWGVFAEDGSLTTGYNISAGATKNGDGDYTVTLGITMSSANFCVIATPIKTTPNNALAACESGRTTTTARVKFVEESGTPVAVNGFHIVVYGDI
jgi:hypothetical protein